MNTELDKIEEYNKLCKRCGMCCRAFHIPMSWKHIERAYLRGYQMTECHTFAYLYWQQITQIEALKINPYLSKCISPLNNGKQYFYTCKFFDDKENICLNYANRPRTCVKFPFYDKYPDDNPGRRLTLYSPDCGYKQWESKTKGGVYEILIENHHNELKLKAVKAIILFLGNPGHDLSFYEIYQCLHGIKPFPDNLIKLCKLISLSIESLIKYGQIERRRSHIFWPWRYFLTEKGKRACHEIEKDK